MKHPYAILSIFLLSIVILFLPVGLGLVIAHAPLEAWLVVVTLLMLFTGTTVLAIVRQTAPPLSQASGTAFLPGVIRLPGSSDLYNPATGQVIGPRSVQVPYPMIRITKDRNGNVIKREPITVYRPEIQTVASQVPPEVQAALARALEAGAIATATVQLASTGQPKPPTLIQEIMSPVVGLLGPPASVESDRVSLRLSGGDLKAKVSERIRVQQPVTAEYREVENE